MEAVEQDLVQGEDGQVDNAHRAAPVAESVSTHEAADHGHHVVEDGDDAHRLAEGQRVRHGRLEAAHDWDVDDSRAACTPGSPKQVTKMPLCAPLGGQRNLLEDARSGQRLVVLGLQGATPRVTRTTSISVSGPADWATSLRTPSANSSPSSGLTTVSFMGAPPMSGCPPSWSPRAASAMRKVPTPERLGHPVAHGCRSPAPSRSPRAPLRGPARTRLGRLGS
jgi:hypothetical protein